MSESLQTNDDQTAADRALMACVRETNELQLGVRYPSANMAEVWRLRGFLITMWLLEQVDMLADRKYPVLREFTPSI